MTRPIAEAEVRVGADTSGLRRGLRRAETQLQRFTRAAGQTGAGPAAAAFGRMGTAATAAAGAIGGIGAATAVAAAGLARSVSAARNAQLAFAEVATIADRTVFPIERIRETSAALSAEFGGTIEGQARALYQSISAGATSAAAAQETLVAANQLSIGGLADIGVSIDGLTSVVNAYSESGLSAGRASDIFFAAVQRGKTTIPELASSVGQVAPLAATAGVSFEELAGAIATLTLNGVSTSEAVTQVRGIIAATVKPTSEAAAAAKALGINFSLAELQSRGLQGFLQYIEQSGASTEQLGRLLGQVEAINGALGLTGPNADKFVSSIDSTTDSVNKSREAYEVVNATLDRKLNRLNALTGAVFEAFGAAVIESDLFKKSLDGTIAAVEALNTLLRGGEVRFLDIRPRLLEIEEIDITPPEIDVVGNVVLNKENLEGQTFEVAGTFATDFRELTASGDFDFGVIEAEQKRRAELLKKQRETEAKEFRNQLAAAERAGRTRREQLIADAEERLRIIERAEARNTRTVQQAAEARARIEERLTEQLSAAASGSVGQDIEARAFAERLANVDRFLAEREQKIRDDAAARIAIIDAAEAAGTTSAKMAAEARARIDEQLQVDLSAPARAEALTEAEVFGERFAALERYLQERETRLRDDAAKRLAIIEQAEADGTKTIQAAAQERRQIEQQLATDLSLPARAEAAAEQEAYTRRLAQVDSFLESRRRRVESDAAARLAVVERTEAAATQAAERAAAQRAGIEQQLEFDLSPEQAQAAAEAQGFGDRLADLERFLAEREARLRADAAARLAIVEQAESASREASARAAEQRANIERQLEVDLSPAAEAEALAEERALGSRFATLQRFLAERESRLKADAATRLAIVEQAEAAALQASRQAAEARARLDKQLEVDLSPAAQGEAATEAAAFSERFAAEGDFLAARRARLETEAQARIDIAQQAEAQATRVLEEAERQRAEINKQLRVDLSGPAEEEAAAERRALGERADATRRFLAERAADLRADAAVQLALIKSREEAATQAIQAAQEQRTQIQSRLETDLAAPAEREALAEQRALAGRSDVLEAFYADRDRAVRDAAATQLAVITQGEAAATQALAAAQQQRAQIQADLDRDLSSPVAAEAAAEAGIFADRLTNLQRFLDDREARIRADAAQRLDLVRQSEEAGTRTAIQAAEERKRVEESLAADLGVPARAQAAAEFQAFQERLDNLSDFLKTREERLQEDAARRLALIARAEEQGALIEIGAAEARNRVLTQLRDDLGAVQAERRAPLESIEAELSERSRIEQEAANIRLTAQASAFEQERILLEQSLAEQRATIEADRDDRAARIEDLDVGAGERAALRLENEARFQADLTRLTAEGEAARLAIEQRTAAERQRLEQARQRQILNGAVGLTNALVGLANVGLKATTEGGEGAVKAQKAVAVAQVAISTAVGIARALELGFPANVLGAAQAVAIGAAQLATIGSTSVGSPGAISAPSGGGIPSASPPGFSDLPDPDIEPASAERQTLNVFAVGDQDVDSLIDRFRDRLGETDNIIFRRGSRQAGELA